jgi:uridine kinase
MMNDQTILAVHAAAPREAVRATFPDGTVLEGAIGTTLEDFLCEHRRQQPVQYSSEIMAAVVDGKLRELGFTLTRDAFVTPMLLSSSDGRRIYRRSLVLLLTTAIHELFPNRKVNVNYAVPDGGFYCTTPQHTSFTSEELAAIEAHMHNIVAENNTIEKRLEKLDTAIALFEERGDEDKVRLLEQRERDELTLYTLRGRSDYYYGYMLPSTGYLRLFRLWNTPTGGFILQYPHSDDPNSLRPSAGNTSRICNVFEEADVLLQRLGVEDIGTLNRISRGERVQEMILVSEAIHDQQITTIASAIRQAHQERGLRLVLIAGPSSSGKTTFSKRLAIHLLALGLRPYTLELDNYFVDRELTPRDTQGNYDFEALETVNIKLFNEHLQLLFQGDEVQLPRFDFIEGRSVAGVKIRLSPNQVLIIEGIHGLNPNLITKVAQEKLYRIYVSALTQLNIDAHNRIPTTDVRLLRRIARDAVTRGHNATDTINRWNSVRQGEKRNIFPYQDNADVIFNSALHYELASLRPIVEPLLLQVEYGTKAHIEANRLLTFLRWVYPFSNEQQLLIPDTSLLREFIGGSILQHYTPPT